MIDIDPLTGRNITGRKELLSRFQRVLTTRPGERIKRREFGNRAIEELGSLNNPNTAHIIANYTFEAIADPVNGLTDFIATNCKPVPTRDGFVITITGFLNGNKINLEGTI